MTQHYTPAQLKAWAGLGPWRTCNVSPDLGHIYGSIGRLATSIGGESNRTQTNAALIAAAPDLARLVLEKDKEIASLRERIEHAHNTARRFYDNNKSNAGKYFLHICDILEPHPPSHEGNQ